MQRQFCFNVLSFSAFNTIYTLKLKGITFYRHLNFIFVIEGLKMPNKLLLLSPIRSVAHLVEHPDINREGPGFESLLEGT